VTFIVALTRARIARSVRATLAPAFVPEVALTDPLALEQIVARQGEETTKIAARRDDDRADNDGCCVIHVSPSFILRQQLRR